MKADLILDSDPIGLAWDPQEYRVRFWGAPPLPGHVRTVEDWRMTGFEGFQQF